MTLQDAYPLPRVDENLDALVASRYFSTLDQISRYWQVSLDRDAQEKLVFCYRVWVMEVEGVDLWSDIGSDDLSVFHGTGTGGNALEEFVLVPWTISLSTP